MISIGNVKWNIENFVIKNFIKISQNFAIKTSALKLRRSILPLQL